MRNFNVIVFVAAVVSLALGIALYYVFQSATSDLSAPGEQMLPGQTQPTQAQVGFTAKKPFSFNAYSQPRDLPELAFESGDGRPLTLESFRGKFVLLNIWATWCGPCREEMPALDRLQARLGGPEFQVLPLSIDSEGPGVIQEFYQELGLTSLGIYLDKAMRAPATFSVIGVPATLFISPQGREIGRVLGPAEWDSPEVIREIQTYMDKLK